MNGAPFLVVGAGPTGLGCATGLAARGPVVVVDRIPVTGGTAGWDDPDVVAFSREAGRAGVALRLGETALRWEDAELLVTGPGSVERIRGRHLFFAGGLRPATMANLLIAGDRPAGVIAGTVAEHLLHAGVKLWNTAAIVGEGPWAHKIGHECHRLGTRVVAVRGNAKPVDTKSRDTNSVDTKHARPSVLSVVGRDRVSGLRLQSPTGEVTVPCDAVILAADPRPNRNIEGALLDGSDGVTFLQPIRPHGPVERHNAGRAAAQAWLDANGDLG
jgi:pyruvate/2-oxoglutarate dehydrogenase complex dihydrolipoamide dehydrogenase (E3) component